MLRQAFLGILISSLIVAPSAGSEEFKKPEQLPVPSQKGASRIDQSIDDLYILCSFYPKPGTCESVYRQAMKDNSIAAQAVRAEFMNYARYLTGGTATLSESDRQYLKDNNIAVPRDLSPANQAGLHNVINDGALSADEKPMMVNSFLSRAVQAELYCGFNKCDDPREQMTTTGT